VKRALLLLAILAVPAAASHAAPSKGGETAALVTAETENSLLVVDLSSGKVVQRLAMPDGPENVETTRSGAEAVVVSTSAGAVTLLSLPRLRVRRTIRGSLRRTSRRSRRTASTSTSPMTRAASWW